MGQDSTTNQGQPSGSVPPTSGGAPLPEACGPEGGGVQPYELAPVESTPSPISSPKPQIVKPGLLADFDEDADFDHDPEVEQAKRGIPPGTKLGAKSGEAKAPIDPSRLIVIPGRGDLKTLAMVGGGVALAAAIGAAFNAADGRNRFFVAISLVFDIAMHTITGVGAIGLAAAMLGKVLRNFELAGARMLVATALFALGFQLNFNASAHILGLALAVGSYFLAVWFLFRLKSQDTIVVSAFHFALFILLYLYQWVAVWAASAAKAAPAAGG